MTATTAYQQLRDYYLAADRDGTDCSDPPPAPTSEGGIRGRGGDGEAHRPYRSAIGKPACSPTSTPSQSPNLGSPQPS